MCQFWKMYALPVFTFTSSLHFINSISCHIPTSIYSLYKTYFITKCEQNFIFRQITYTTLWILIETNPVPLWTKVHLPIVSANTKLLKSTNRLAFGLDFECQMNRCHILITLSLIETNFYWKSIFSITHCFLLTDSSDIVNC